ncbi:preprotein translocase subunit SecB [Allopseudospirillum japonicum]|uniref:Protein-export protein SecB n=1 Tax=Allopseudospirillum japonicum TaxID=64971 RepID=A0A1H6TP62_9GAMM|nr:protein-export chaperone SecB [Allopseudospirillum japonicum]SEI81781.1 preprotein translocase subunit SecB [Allopseudospirillum japonicum]
MSDQPQFALQRIYLKDLSFESPNAPQVFAKGWQPKVNLDLNTHSTLVEDKHYEVVVGLTVTVSDQEQTVFLVEIKQAGLFLIDGLDQASLQHTLGAFCPNILFPYAREAVDNLVTKGGFPPLMLAPVNFEALYAEQQQRQAAQATENA